MEINSNYEITRNINGEDVIIQLSESEIGRIAYQYQVDNLRPQIINYLKNTYDTVGERFLNGELKFDGVAPDDIINEIIEYKLDKDDLKEEDDVRESVFETLKDGDLGRKLCSLLDKELNSMMKKSNTDMEH